MERPEPYVNERLDHPGIVATITVNQEQVVQQAFRDGCWIVGTNVLEPDVLSDQQLIAAYKGQSSPERGFRGSLRSTLFGFLGLETGAHDGAQFHHGPLRGTVYRLAEFRLRSRLSQTRAAHSRSSPQADDASYDAMGLSMLSAVLNSFTSRLLSLPRSSFYVFSRFIGSSYSSSGRSMKNAICALLLYSSMMVL